MLDTLKTVLAVTLLIAIIIMGAVGARIYNENKALKADNKTLTANFEAAQKAIKTETKIQTVTRTVYLKAQKAATHVQTIDPKCTNEAELVDAFRADYDGVQPDTEAKADSASLGSGIL